MDDLKNIMLRKKKKARHKTYKLCDSVYVKF